MNDRKPYERGLTAAVVFLDGLIAYEDSASRDANTAAVELAMHRLNELGVVTVTISDNDEATVDIEHLLSGVGRPMK